MTGDSDSAGGFRWNLTPSAGGEGDGDNAAAAATAPAAEPAAGSPINTGSPTTAPITTEPPATEPIATQSPTPSPETAADAEATKPAPVDDWDVPTAASPIIGRSVFPLGPPAGAPTLLPPPYIPPPTALGPAPTSAPKPPPLDSSLEGVTESLAAHPVGLADPVGEGPETSAIDVLFGESRFVEYGAAGAQEMAGAPGALIAPAMPPAFVASPMFTPPATSPPPAFPGTTAMPPLSARRPASLPQAGLPQAALPPAGLPAMSSLPFDTLPPLPVSTMAVFDGPRTVANRAMPRSQKILIGIAAVLVAGLALVALYLLGMRIGENSSAAEPVVTSTTKPSATATTPPASTVGPVAPGDHSWDELLGSECLTFYESPWQDNYTVVDCAEPHTGQLLSRVALPDANTDAYPALADLQSRITLACSAPTVLDYAAAGAFDDIQLEVSFPATAEQWEAGNRTTYCFATRTGRGDLTGSLAAPAA